MGSSCGEEGIKKPRIYWISKTKHSNLPSPNVELGVSVKEAAFSLSHWASGAHLQGRVSRQQHTAQLHSWHSTLGRPLILTRMQCWKCSSSQLHPRVPHCGRRASCSGLHQQARDSRKPCGAASSLASHLSASLRDDQQQAN